MAVPLRLYILFPHLQLLLNPRSPLLMDHYLQYLPDLLHLLLPLLLLPQDIPSPLDVVSGSSALLELLPVTHAHPLQSRRLLPSQSRPHSRNLNRICKYFRTIPCHQPRSGNPSSIPHYRTIPISCSCRRRHLRLHGYCPRFRSSHLLLNQSPTVMVLLLFYRLQEEGLEESRRQIKKNSNKISFLHYQL